MFLRYILMFFVASAYCQDEAFDGSNEPIISTNGRKCNTIEGTVTGCAECYPCDYQFVSAAEAAGKVVSRLTLFNSSCIGNEVCCVKNIDALTIGPRIGADCGKPGTDLTRTKNRDFGKTEFPWMAFVYSKSIGAFKCSATFIEDTTLLTSASCVQGLSASDLKVSFNYKPSAKDHMADISRVVVHEAFDKKSNLNDIAILKLANAASVPQWATPACLPTAEPTIGSICTTVAQENYFKLRPLRTKHSKCGGATHYCATTPPLHPERPWAGAGLFCEQQATPQQRYLSYTISGIALRPPRYTSVHQYLTWIEDNMK